MQDKKSEELKKILKGASTRNAASFIRENEQYMIDPDEAFSEYMRQILKEKKLLQQEVFLRADIPERYGYKLISRQKTTRQRDVILRLCYAGELTLEQTQKALRLYRLPELYVKIPRDALIMICFNERPGSIAEINELLISSGMDPLRVSGKDIL